MRPKRGFASVSCELLIVLLITGTVFMWGKGATLAERGYEAIGGEYLLLAVPVIYYVGKRIVLDWITYLRKR